MDRIPISFDHQGKKYSGYFSKVAGAGDTSVFHLMNDKHFYLGRLRYTGKWVFDPSLKGEELAELATFFGKFVSSRGS